MSMLQYRHVYTHKKANIMSEPIEWITTKEAAEIMDVALSTVSRLCREKKLECRQFGEGQRSVWQVSRASATAYQKSVGGRPRNSKLENGSNL